MGRDAVLASEVTDPPHLVEVEQPAEPAADRRLDRDDSDPRLNASPGSSVQDSLNIFESECASVARQRYKVEIAQHLGAVA